MSKGFARAGWSRGSEQITSAALVASATPHTKGSWVEVDASAAKDVTVIAIMGTTTIGAGATDTSTLLDIGVGAGGSETVVVANVPIGALIANVPFTLPKYIPAGSRIAARIQGAVVSQSWTPSWLLGFGSRPGMWGGYTIAETIGVDTATSGPTTGDLADNAWDEAVASTANAYRALTFHPCQPPGITNITGGLLTTVDIGMGAAGSEVVLGSAQGRVNTTEQLITINNGLFIEAGIPAGARLAIRKNSTSDLSGALIGWR